MTQPDPGRVTFRCGKCRKTSELTRAEWEQVAGMRLPCPHCGTAIRIPTAKPKRRPPEAPTVQEESDETSRGINWLLLGAWVAPVVFFLGFWLIESGRFARFVDGFGAALYSTGQTLAPLFSRGALWAVLYAIVWVPLAAYVYFDAQARDMDARRWTLLVLVAGVFTFPFYYAKRLLLPKEVREGGVAWNRLRGFALVWTWTCLYGGALKAVTILRAAAPPPQAPVAPELGDELPGFYEYLSGLVGGLQGLQSQMTWVGFVSGLGTIWLVPLGGAAILGYFLRNPAMIEHGPETEKAEAPAAPSAAVAPEDSGSKTNSGNL